MILLNIQPHHTPWKTSRYLWPFQLAKDFVRNRKNRKANTFGWKVMIADCGRVALSPYFIKDSNVKEAMRASLIIYFDSKIGLAWYARKNAFDAQREFRLMQTNVSLESTLGQSFAFILIT